MGLHPAADQGLAPLRGPRTGQRPAGRRARRLEPLRRAVRDGRAGVRHRLLREVRLRPADLHARASTSSSSGRPPTSSRRPASSPPTTRTPTRRCAPAASSSSSPAATTTSTDRRRRANTIDFGGRTGYVRAALNAGVPIVPSVSIGGQESQLYLTRGTEVAKLLRLDKLFRAKILPISFGFPFGLSAVLPVNVPLPTKIVTQVLRAHRHRRGVRRGPRRRRGRRPRPPRHAGGARRAGQGTSPPGARLSHGTRPTDSPTPLGLVTTMVRAGVIAPLRPDKYVRIAAAMARENMGITSGFAAAAQRCPDRAGLIDELGTLTLRRDRPARRRLRRRRCRALPGGHARRRRDHGPQPPRLRRGADRRQPHRRRRAAAEHVVRRARAGRGGGAREASKSLAVIYDEEFTATVDRALADAPDAARIVAWTDGPDARA